MASKLSARHDKVCFNSEAKVATIQCRVDNMTHYTHLSAFINACQRVNTLNQISMGGVACDDIIRIVMDGMFSYVLQSKCEIQVNGDVQTRAQSVERRHGV